MPQIFTVSELNLRIEERLEGDIRLHDLWARGEVSNYLHHRSGHRYFTLKDENTQIACVLFRGNGQSLGFEIGDGKNILVFGDIAVYKPQGRVQLLARGIKLDVGLGARHMQLEALKKRLTSEGLFAPERKRPLPGFPERIGIVTSPQGAALQDVLRTLGTYPARIIISPARVQGEGAEESIASALRALRGLTDVIIVCRGGGSTEDLWCFNSETVARAIFSCDVPVISAVGHETDVTIADHVADVRAATPTAAAKIAVPDTAVLLEGLSDAKSRMQRALWNALERQEERLLHLRRAVSAKRMHSMVRDERQRLDGLCGRLESAQSCILEAQRSRIQLAKGRLAAVSPKATLCRGYAIARSAQGVIRSPNDASVGQEIELILESGRLRCKVLECLEERGALL